MPPSSSRASTGRAAAGLGVYAAAFGVLANPRVQRVTTLLPVAMLSALVVVQLVGPGTSTGARYALDWRVLAGVAAAALALLLRRGFLVVFVVAVAVTALLRLLVPAA